MEVIWPRVYNFLCCIPLKTGAFIIGYASIMMAIAFISSISWSLSKVVNFVRSHENVTVQEHSPEEVAKVALSLYISHGYFLLVMFYSLVINLVLIVALHKMKLNILRLYIYAGVVSLALTFLLMMITGAFFGLYIVVPVLIYCGLLFYCLLTVRSTYFEMVEEMERKDYEMRDLSQEQPLALGQNELLQ